MEEIKFYGLKNDYMFRAVLQTSEPVLRGLICALLNLKPNEIMTCIIENPIVLGSSIDEKTCIMDIKVLLNNSKRLNIELQIAKQLDWTDRSLFYLCRTFNKLPKGEDYSKLKEAIHIGILDFTPFPDAPEFYSENYFMNVKTHQIYSRKMCIRVLDLTQLEQVSEEERRSDLYYWAKLFMATSWEEMRMLAEKNKTLDLAVSTIHLLNENEQIRMMCEGRERYEHDAASNYNGGLREGEAKGRIESLLLVLSRFGTLPAELETKISSEKDLDTLTNWLELAISVTTLDAFTDQM